MAKSKLTKARHKAVCTAIRAGATYVLAAQAAGVHRATLFNWLKQGQEQEEGPHRAFFDDVKKAEADGALRALRAVMKAAGGDWKAAAWMLERRHGYVKPSETDGAQEATTAQRKANADLRDSVEQMKAAGGIDAAISGAGDVSRDEWEDMVPDPPAGKDREK